MLLMYRRKSVGEMTPPCGTPSLILTLSLMYPCSLSLAIPCQTRLSDQTKWRQPSSFLGMHSLSLGQ